MNDIKVNDIKKMTVGDWVVKLLSALAFVCTIEVALAEIPFYKPDYFAGISIVLHAIFVLAFFAISLLMIRPSFDGYILTLTCLVLLCLTAYQQNSVYYSLICSLVMGGIVFYCSDRLKLFRITDKMKYTFVIIMLIFTAAFIGILTLLRWLSHWTPNYDFGIFAQMYEYMKSTFVPFTTCERDVLLSHFAVHFSPVLYLLLPFYMIFPSPATLLISEGILVAAGIIPLCLICKNHNLSNKFTVALAFVYALHPVLISSNFYYFHENCFLTVLLLWLFWFNEKDLKIGTYIFAFLVMSVKEDAPIYIAFFGIYLLFTEKKRYRGIILSVLSVAYFLIVTEMMKMYGYGIMTYRYGNFIFTEDGTLLEAIINVIKNPAYVFTTLFTTEKLEFLMYMLVPIACLPLAIKKPSRVILLFPMMLINLMTDYVYQYDIGFQYTYASVAFIFYLAIINTGELDKNTAKKMLISAVCASMIFFCGTCWQKTKYIPQYKENKEQSEIINKALDTIPEGKSVIADTFILPALYDRKELYDLQYTNENADYVVIDLRTSRTDKDRAFLNSDEYETAVLKENIIQILRRKETAFDGE